MPGFGGRVQPVYRWLALAAAVLMAVGTPFAAYLLHTDWERRERVELLLTRLNEQTGNLNTLEWQFITTQRFTKRFIPELFFEAGEVRKQINMSYAGLLGLEPSNGQFMAYFKTYREYEKALDEQYLLLRSGKTEEALQLGLKQADPAYHKLKWALSDAEGFYEQDNVRRSRSLHAMIAAMVVISGAAISWLLVLFERATQKLALVSAEQKALRRSEERFLSLMQNSSDGIVRMRPDGSFDYASDSFYNLLGYKGADRAGPKNVTELLHEQDVSLFCTGLGRCLDEKCSGEFRFRHASGRWVPMEVVSSRLGGPEEPIILNFRDITDRKRLESIAEAVNTMDHIGYIFAGVRHEIGNPVNSIKMILSVLRTGGNYSEENVKKYLERAESELSRIEYLLKALKSFNMYEIPEMQELSTSAFIDNFLSLVREHLGENSISLEAGIKPGAERIYADPRALQQVLLNVLTNASDALAGASAPRISINLLPEEDMVRISVLDNGCGMSRKQQEDLFKPFYTTKLRGTGLGLVITKKLVARMGGTIGVKSREGEGTAVEIRLSAAGPKHSA